jgi:hypothetical protein
MPWGIGDSWAPQPYSASTADNTQVGNPSAGYGLREKAAEALLAVTKDTTND